MVGGGGFFGSRRGFLWYGLGVSLEKPRVVFKKVTCGFKKNHPWFFEKSPVVFPKKGWNRTKERLGLNQRKPGARPI